MERPYWRTSIVHSNHLKLALVILRPLINCTAQTYIVFKHFSSTFTLALAKKSQVYIFQKMQCYRSSLSCTAIALKFKMHSWFPNEGHY